ncbi:MAG TPA: sulfurtransferase complex subunit TusB [Pseudomonadales bacterium]|nr:sulfurtransferase complex subunit TusB [Pseudomonadales bacterium]
MNSTTINGAAATLHTLNCSAREHTALLQRLLRCASAGDSLLLLENGVYNITDDAFLTTITRAGLTLYCLQADLLARGLHNHPRHNTVNDATIVDDNGFVELACHHHKVVSWFV